MFLPLKASDLRIVLKMVSWLNYNAFLPDGKNVHGQILIIGALYIVMGSYSSKEVYCRNSSAHFSLHASSSIGTWFYEVTLLTSGVMQIGWATRESKFLSHVRLCNFFLNAAVFEHSFLTAWVPFFFLFISRMDTELGTIRFR